MWTSIVKKTKTNTPTKSIDKQYTEKTSNINCNNDTLFELYHSNKCIEFIIDIKTKMNKYGFKILDKDNNNLTENFINFLKDNVMCIEENESDDENNSSDNEIYYD